MPTQHQRTARTVFKTDRQAWAHGTAEAQPEARWQEPGRSRRRLWVAVGSFWQLLWLCQIPLAVQRELRFMSHWRKAGNGEIKPKSKAQTRQPNIPRTRKRADFSATQIDPKPPGPGAPHPPTGPPLPCGSEAVASGSRE